VTGIPFVGENGFYPIWARGGGRWIFQRTLISVGGLMAGYAEIAAQNVSSADQIIVWVPRKGFVRYIFHGIIHKERQEALYQLFGFLLRCYGNNCILKLSSPQQIQSVVSEFGLRPEQWRLSCPSCGGTIGPDLEPVSANKIIRRWQDVGRLPLENPAASAAFKSAPVISNLEDWIKKNNPSHLELAYLGQQLWPDTKSMLDSLCSTD
jgi:hypothetical protein